MLASLDQECSQCIACFLTVDPARWRCVVAMYSASTSDAFQQSPPSSWSVESLMSCCCRELQGLALPLDMLESGTTLVRP
jgi:hypothetical protein